MPLKASVWMSGGGLRLLLLLLLLPPELFSRHSPQHHLKQLSFSAAPSARLDSPLPHERAEYALAINRAYDLFEKQQLGAASQLANRLQKQFPHQADSYYLLGLLHLRAELPQLAELYFKESLSHSQTFLQENNRFSLYFYLARLEFEKQALAEEALYLKAALALSQQDTTALYKKARGKAAFLLGLNHRKQGQWQAAEAQLRRAAKENYQAKLAYLLLAHYYAVFNEAQLEAQVFAETGQLRKYPTAERERNFLFYYRLFRQLEAVEEEASEETEKRLDEKYQTLVRTVEGFYRTKR